MTHSIKIKIKIFIITIGSGFIFLFLWTAIDKANPLYLYGVALPVQELMAYLETSDLKPRWQAIAKNKGDCRILLWQWKTQICI